jgi:hypothetical protein
MLSTHKVRLERKEEREAEKRREDREKGWWLIDW